MESEQVLTERNWLAAFVATLAALVGGSLVATEQVYDRFIWQYFWGPVYSDANDARCAVQTGDGIELLGGDAACQAAESTGVVAYTGYSTVSEVGYMVALVFLIIGVLLLLNRLALGQDRALFFSLVPFMLFGGALRVVEDATDAATAAGVDPAIGFPLNTLLISPIIYVTVFVITLAALLVSARLESTGTVADRHRTMGIIGTGVLGLTLAYLFGLAITADYVDFFPQILVLDVVIATVLAYVIYLAVDRYKPEINAGTGQIGLVVIWAHAIDGVANVIAADWTTTLGHPFTYGAKHPANRIIIEITEQYLPGSIAAVIGTSWPFLVVKLVVAVAIVWLFDERIFDESPRYSILLLVAATAVGLGPGTRDILRVTLAI
ncbi:DUF63 family protein [Halosimplex salinum]|uniref:DUF63 family protein n=1 Tax=Halosimplex salinum TaxID=1710538 RepID=UPI000F45F9B7|nr:DUF63 family protein [Halosimplex salinum]